MKWPDICYIYFLFAEELTHSDGDPFDPKTDYNIGLRKYKDDYDCFYLKQTDDYKLQGTVCTKEKNFFCLWQEHECPEEYRYIGQLSNGRTCHGFPETALEEFGKLTCDDTGDHLRKQWIPDTPYKFDRFRREFV